jgi:hypothetical protein
MNASISECLSTPFVIRSNEIESLTKLFENNVGAVKASIKCVDGIYREFDSVSDLLEYENSRSKAISELRLIARSNDWTKEASVTFSSSKFRAISMEYRADSDSVYKLKTGTLDVIDGARPWYGGFQKIDFIIGGFVIMGMLWISLVIAVASSKKESTENSDTTKLTPKDSAIGQLLFLGIIIALLAIGSILNNFRDAWFPYAVFAIGQGNDRFQSLERFQWNIILPVFLASITSVLACLVKFWWGRAVRQSSESSESN